MQAPAGHEESHADSWTAENIAQEVPDLCSLTHFVTIFCGFAIPEKECFRQAMQKPFSLAGMQLGSNSWSQRNTSSFSDRNSSGWQVFEGTSHNKSSKKRSSIYPKGYRQHSMAFRHFLVP
jgi:hypothetical protein